MTGARLRPEGGAPDVVVVGGGAAGCVLAARLSEDPSRRVLLLEAGEAPRTIEGFPRDVLDGATLRAAAPGHPVNWDLQARIAPGRDWGLARGRILGGSTAVNGGYLVRPRPSDADRWMRDGGGEWSWERMLPRLVRIEHDLDLGDAPGHGSSGPVAIRRALLAHPVSAAAIRGAGELGLPEEPDKNGTAPSGAGPVPLGVVDGIRVNAAMAYLLPAMGRPNLAVRGGVRVDRVEVRAGRAVAVHATGADGAERIAAGEIVLAAGALASPAILLRSGIGPAGDLRALGIDVVRDAPGVGAAISDHPQLTIDWRPARPMDVDGRTWMGALLDSADDAVELLPATRSIAALLGGADDGTLSIMSAVHAPRRRGGLGITSADPGRPARIDLGYLGDDEDRRLLRAAARLGAELLATSAFRPLVGERLGPSAAELGDDAALDAWILGHLATSFHSCGTVPFGPEADPGAVVDGAGRVRGVAGLRVADTSILPTAPARGPALSAYLVGETIADAITAS